ncbi:transcriptional regulator, partial [Xanthomonas citri pv. citri]|nr:transcriptional regulator [Xanthomonas citri pv. citri]
VGCFDTENGALDVLSIFRDTLVDVPWEIKKINSVYNRQGMDGLKEQIKNLIGYKPDYSFVMELSAVAEIVDALGGISFEVPCNMDYDDPT